MSLKSFTSSAAHRVRMMSGFLVVLVAANFSAGNAYAQVETSYSGEVTNAKGALASLMPPGTEFFGTIAIVPTPGGTSINTDDRTEALFNMIDATTGRTLFCFNYMAECAVAELSVPIIEIMPLELAFGVGGRATSGTIGLQAFLPTFGEEILITLDLSARTFMVEGNRLGTASGIGGLVGTDSDNDTIDDSADNCTLVPNLDQRDTNGDGYGNACDPDLDNNGIVNFADLALWAPFFNTATMGDADFNGDGAANFADHALYPTYFLQPPGPSGVAPNTITIDFEGTPSSYDFGFGGGFGGGVSAVVLNPVSGGINTSAQVVRHQKFIGEVFAGSVLMLPDPVEVVTGSSYTMKVWSPRQVTVLLKLEGNESAEVNLTHGGTGWEELTFDFSVFSGIVDGYTFIFDLGIVGNADSDPDNWTFYIDDLTLIPLDDTTPPTLSTVSISSSNANTALATIGDVITVSLTASESIMAPEVTIAGSAASGVTGADASWQATRTLTANDIDGAITFSIGYSDLAGNAGLSVTQPTDASAVTYDATAPSVVINGVAAALTTLDPIRVTFEFDEDVSDFEIGDIAVTNGAASDFASTDASTYTADVTPDGAGDLTVGVAAGAALDGAGNPSEAASDVTSLIDTVAPLVVIQAVPANFTTLAAIGVTFQFSEPVSGFDVTDIQVTNGAASAFVAVDVDTYTADVTPDGAGDLTVGVAAGAAQDGVGNPSVVASDVTSLIDAVAPLVVIQGAPANFTTLAAIDVTFQFSEAVSGFALGDIQTTNGTVTAFTTVDADTYTASVTPNGTGDLTVGVAAGAAQDGVGNPSDMATRVVVLNALDMNAPLFTAISIASNNANPAFAATGDLLTINMMANVDIIAPTVIINGVPADTVTGAGTTWQATRTLLASDPETTVSFTLDFEDLNGNSGPQSTVTTDASSVTFDITAPTLAITGLPAAFTTLDPIAITFQFSEQVSGFDAGDIDVTNGAVSMLVAQDSATYTANVTPDGNGDLNVTVAAGLTADSAGNASTGASESSTQDTEPRWQLVWSDEFDGGSLDAANWTARTDVDCPAPCDGVQSYSAANVTVSGGLLTIQAEQNAGPSYLSGLIDSRGKREFKYGRVEIDAIMPGTLGTRPSLLMLPANDIYGPWPQSGEVDIANAPDLGDGGASLLEHSLQYGLPVPENTVTGDTSNAPANVTTVVITYAIEWGAGEIRWFVDDVNVLTQSQDNWYAYGEDADGVYTTGIDDAPFNEVFYLALNLAIDASADGSTSFPQTLQVDAVRVYECANAIDPVAGSGCSTGDPSVLPVDAPDAPYTETIDAYIDALATLGFIDESMTTNSGTLEASSVTSDMSVSVSSTLNAIDPEGGQFWNLDISAATGSADILVQPGDFPGSNAFFDLTGGGTAGEILFRMRVNSVTGSTTLAVGLDDGSTGSGAVTLPYAADGQWQNVSIKISDVVTDSVMNGATLDLTRLSSIFRLSVSNGSINMDIDDIRVKVACRDTNGCELTPRLQAFTETSIYFEDFDGFAGTTLTDFTGPTPIIWRRFTNVFEDGVYQFDYSGIASAIGPQMSALVTNQGGVDQGTQQLSVYSDYECCFGTPNTGHQGGTGLGTVEVNIYREFGDLLTSDDAGKILKFNIQAKRGDIGGNSVAFAFIKVLDPNDGFSTTAIDEVEMTTASTDWLPYTMEITVGDWEGQLLQIGFRNLSGNFDPSAIFYDNVELLENAQ